VGSTPAGCISADATAWHAEPAGSRRRSPTPAT